MRLKSLFFPLLLILIVCIFFYKLFFPTLSLFVTPDYGQSDGFQLNYPAKFSLYESLHNNTVPLWSKYIGTGFPQLAEGQIGTFNIINLLLYKFLPFIYALNVGYISIFVTSALGTYFYLRFLKHTPLISFFGAFLFSLSGFFVTHMSHINLIQASSFLPWIFLFSHRYISYKKLTDLLLCTLFLSQQFLAGFPQITFITLNAIALLFVFALYQKDYEFKKLYLPIAAVIIFVALCAVQILPSQEFLKTSSRKEGFVLSKATQYSFPWGHFAAFIKPDFFGTPKNGTYPPLIQSRGSIYWENNGYIGVIPLVLAALSIFLWKRQKMVHYYWLLLVVSALMMTGKDSPIYLIYSFFPFNYFRVPSRYILLFVWALVILAAYGLKYLQSKRLTNFASALIITLSCIHLWLFVYSYNPTGKASEWLKEPTLSKELPQNERYFTLTSGLLWNRYFYSTGWQKTEPFNVMRNFVRPNVNLFYHKEAYQVYPILVSNRYGVINALLEDNIPLNSVDETFKTNDISKKILAMNSIGSIISHFENSSYQASASVTLDDEKMYLYTVDRPLPRARVVYDYKIVETVESLTKEIEDKSFDPKKTVLLEKKPEGYTVPEKLPETDTATIQWKKDTNTEVALETSTPIKSILLLADLYFPGWEATIDGKKVEILAANASQRALVLPPGTHKVAFVYKPDSYKNGLIISLLANVLIIAGVVVAFFYPNLGTRFSTR